MYHTFSDKLPVSIAHEQVVTSLTSQVIKRDVKKLGKRPRHLSVVLSIPNEPKDVTLLLNRLDILIHDACEVAAWCSAAEIPVLSIYERQGMITRPCLQSV